MPARRRRGCRGRPAPPLEAGPAQVLPVQLRDQPALREVEGCDPQPSGARCSTVGRPPAQPAAQQRRDHEQPAATRSTRIRGAPPALAQPAGDHASSDGGAADSIGRLHPGGPMLGGSMAGSIATRRLEAADAARTRPPSPDARVRAARASRRRRPSGEAPPLPRQLNRSGRFWLALAGAASGRPDPDRGQRRDHGAVGHAGGRPAVRCWPAAHRPDDGGLPGRQQRGQPGDPAHLVGEPRGDGDLAAVAAPVRLDRHHVPGQQPQPAWPPG